MWGKMEKIAQFIYALYYYGSPVVNTISLILGVIIIYKKDTLTKLLGLWIVSGGLGYFISSLIILTSTRVSPQVYSNLSMVSTILQAMLSLAALASVFLYAKFRYKAKGFVPLILIQLLSIPFVLLVALLGNKYFVKDFASLYNFSLIRNIISSVISIVLLAIIMMAYYKHRDKEPNIPKMWYVLCFQIGFTACCIILYIVLIIIGHENFKGRDIVDFIELILNLLWIFVMPAAAVYIFRNGKNKKAGTKGGGKKWR